MLSTVQMETLNAQCSLVTETRLVGCKFVSGQVFRSADNGRKEPGLNL